DLPKRGQPRHLPAAHHSTRQIPSMTSVTWAAVRYACESISTTQASLRLRIGSGIHRVEEVRIRLGLLQLVDKELDRIGGAHRRENPTQNEYLLKIRLLYEQVLFARPRLENVHRREN